MNNGTETQNKIHTEPLDIKQKPRSETESAIENLENDNKWIEEFAATRIFKVNPDGTLEKLNIVETVPESGEHGMKLDDYMAMDKEQIGENVSERAEVSSSLGQIDPLSIENNNNADPEKQEISRVGATIQDSKQTTVVPVRTGNMMAKSRNDRADAYLNDVDWDLNKLTTKFSLIKDVVWAITDNALTIIDTLTLPKDILVTPAQKAPFDVTKLWKCKNIRIKIVLKTSPFYAGSLGIGFTPFNFKPEPRRMINMGAMIQKASQNEGLELLIPFRYPYGYLDITDPVQLGQFCIFVIAPLRTGPDNPNSVTMTVYAAIEESEFKIPDVVPPTRYISHKLDKNSIVITTPESGRMNSKPKNHAEYMAKQQTSKTQSSAKAVKMTLCDINMDPRDMQKTVMCAGEGTLGKTRVGHFQDMPTSLIQLGKRWRTVDTFQSSIKALNRFRMIIPLSDLYKTAMNGLDLWYGLMRGSINIRIQVMSGNVRGMAMVSLRDLTDNKIYPGPTIEGVHYFDQDVIGQFSVPWLQSAFTNYSDGSITSGSLYIYMDNFNTENTPIIYEISVCLGDDFHMGVFLGASKFVYEAWKPANVTTQYPIPLVAIPTVPESGIIEQIGRVIETTIPIVDNVSALAELLDATPLTVQPTPLWQRKVPYSIATDNVQYIERLMTTNHNGMSLPDKDCFGSSTSECDIHNLLVGTKSYLETVSWPASATAGEVLFKTPIGPNGLPGYDGQLVDVIPSIFNKWTGGCLVMFDIIATEMHRGQLYISYTPNSVDDISYAGAPQTYFTTVDLSSGRGTVCLFCPYLSHIPYRTSIGDEPETNQTHSGKIMVFVQNPLRATSTVSPNVDIVIYKAYADDFSLAVYGRSDIN